jgi:hypothetical protein
MTPNVILKVSLGLLFGLFALSVPAAAQEGRNLLPNPGFEVNECRNTPNGTEPPVCGWWRPGQWGEIVRDTSNPHSGSASLYVTDCDESGCAPRGYGFSAWTNCMSLTTSGPQEASFWYRVAAGEFVSIAGNYFSTPNCTGAALGYLIEDEVIADSNWHQ